MSGRVSLWFQRFEGTKSEDGIFTLNQVASVQKMIGFTGRSTAGLFCAKSSCVYANRDTVKGPSTHRGVSFTHCMAGSPALHRK